MNHLRDYATFLVKAQAAGFAYEKRDDGAPSMSDIKATQEKLLKTFEAFKEKNDARLKEIEARGGEDPVTAEQVEKIAKELEGLRSVRDDLDKLAKRMARPGGEGGGALITPEQKEHKEAFLKLLRRSDNELVKRELQEIEAKAVTTTTDGAGGYAVPEVISQTIHRELVEASVMRGLVDVVNAGSKDYKELVDSLGMAYGWVGEGDARAETGTPTLNEAAPTFGMIYAYPKASEESLDDIFFDVERWLVNSAVEAFDAGEENAIVNGNGVKKPTGFLNGTPTTQADGARAFGTLQYVASGGAATMTDADKFIDLVQSLKKGYRRNARWLMNKATVGEVMKLKDGDGNYLWKMGNVQEGQPDRLLGYGVAESEEMPDVAADAFPVAFGDFKAGYVLVPLVGLRITRDEVTTPGYVKFYVRRRVGGSVRKSEAIKLLKVAAA